jgi:hypothetical protein
MNQRRPSAFFIPAPEMVKANIGLYRNALIISHRKVPHPRTVAASHSNPAGR